jgi:hypothetical protein
MPNQSLDELVSVSVERYAELKALEESIPSRIQDAILQYKKESLRKLHERDKIDPESVKARMKRYIAKNRDKINERRREKRKKDHLESVTQTTQSVIIDMMPVSEVSKQNVANVANVSYVPNLDMTVRFDD